MFKRIITAALLFGMAATAPPALAAACAPHDALTGQLSAKYAEKLAARGLQDSKSLLEIWVSDKTGSFTVLVTNPEGISCIVSSGSHWIAEKAEAVLPGVSG